MDFSFILSSLNKLSIVAFIITVIILFYEVYLLSRDKGKKSMPNIPAFNEKVNPPTMKFTALKVDNQIKTFKKNNKLLIINLIVFLVVFAVTSIIGLNDIRLSSTQKNTTSLDNTNLIYSKGIIIFDKDWNELKNEGIKRIKTGDKIILGVDKINNSDIDMARIKVNEPSWSLENTTLNFDKIHNVFYQEYQIASNESSLKVDAQLHSKSKGWLGK